MRTKSILFKVVAVSSNTNSFGLRGHVLVSRTGLAAEIGLNHLNELPDGSLVRVPVRKEDLTSIESLLGAIAIKTHGEIPRALPKPPKALLTEVWKTKRSKS